MTRKVYPDFLTFDPNRPARRSPAQVWPGYEWSINLRIDGAGRIQEATVFAYHVETPEEPPVGVIEVEFGPFDDLGEELRNAMVAAAIRASQLELW
jgi:hypothetical protein